MNTIKLRRVVSTLLFSGALASLALAPSTALAQKKCIVLACQDCSCDKDCACVCTPNGSC